MDLSLVKVLEHQFLDQPPGGPLQEDLMELQLEFLLPEQAD